MSSVFSCPTGERSGDDAARLEREALQLARRLALVDGAALVSACRTVGGEDGAALAYALIDMIKEGCVPLPILPLADVAALLSLRRREPGVGVRPRLAALIEAVEACAEAAFAGDGQGFDEADGVGAMRMAA